MHTAHHMEASTAGDVIVHVVLPSSSDMSLYMAAPLPALSEFLGLYLFGPWFLERLRRLPGVLLQMALEFPPAGIRSLHLCLWAA